MDKKVKIAVDAMGGDFSPQEPIKACLDVIKETDVEIHLIGDQEVIKREIDKYTPSNLESIHIHHTKETVKMDEEPLEIIKKKNRSSMRIAIEMLKQGEVDAAVSAGNSGAMVAASIFLLNRVKGIDRPAIATIMPSLTGKVLLIDAGANSVCKAFNLVQFAIMGFLYLKNYLLIKEPKIAILSNGQEDSKGTEITRQANELLKKSSLNYQGYIEGENVYKGDVDIIVCDGFVGNILLKVSEGVIETLKAALKHEIERSFFSRVGYIISKRSLSSFKSRFDYSEYGGAPLLGVNGTVFICHGKSSANAIKNGIKQAARHVEKNIISTLKEELTQSEDLYKIGKKPSFLQKVFHTK